MKKIDLYILKKYYATFFFILFLLCVVSCIIDYTTKSDDFIEHQLPWSVVFYYYLCVFLYVIIYLTPITAFIATIYITSRMAHHAEIIAIIAAGVNMRRILLPYAIGSIFIGIISFFLVGWVIPDFNKFRVDFEIAYIKKPFSYSEEHTHFKVGADTYFYCFRYRDGLCRKAVLEKMKARKIQSRITADRAIWDSVQAKWRLEQWTKRVFNEAGDSLTSGASMTLPLRVSAKDFESNYGNMETLDLDALSAYISFLKSRGDRGSNLYVIERAKRYVQPFVILLLTLLGVVVSARKSRQGSAFFVALGFGIAFLYVIVFRFAEVISEVGLLHPNVGVLLPNVIFSVITYLLYRNLPK